MTKHVILSIPEWTEGSFDDGILGSFAGFCKGGVCVAVGGSGTGMNFDFVGPGGEGRIGCFSFCGSIVQLAILLRILAVRLKSDEVETDSTGSVPHCLVESLLLGAGSARTDFCC